MISSDKKDRGFSIIYHNDDKFFLLTTGHAMQVKCDIRQYSSSPIQVSNKLMYYMVSNMEMPYSKELLWLHFWRKKCVHFDIWKILMSEIIEGPFEISKYQMYTFLYHKNPG